VRFSRRKNEQNDDEESNSDNSIIEMENAIERERSRVYTEVDNKYPIFRKKEEPHIVQRPSFFGSSTSFERLRDEVLNKKPFPSITTQSEVNNRVQQHEQFSTISPKTYQPLRLSNSKSKRSSAGVGGGSSYKEYASQLKQDRQFFEDKLASLKSKIHNIKDAVNTSSVDAPLREQSPQRQTTTEYQPTINVFKQEPVWTTTQSPSPIR